MKIATIITLALLTAVSVDSVQAQQRARVSGTVTDATDGGPLPANVTIAGTTTGTQADPITGRYEVVGLDPGTYTVEVSLLGYVTQSLPVTLAAGQNVALNVQLAATVLDVGGEVTVIGNKVVKREDFPMPMETISVAEILNDVSTSSEGVLRKKTGVDMQCTGVDRCETVLRGFNNAFSGAAYVLTDYRQAAVPSLAVNINPITPALSLDLDRVEVVRGPASALYGAGVDAGVIHFFTKDPFTYPGTSVAVSGGERSFFLFEGRHANRVTDRFAYKITGMYGQADDWKLDLSDPTDSTLARADCSAAGDPAAEEACFEAGGARNPDYRKFNANGTLQFRLGDQSELVVTGGRSGLDATVLSGIGTLQADGYAYTYGQVRFQTRNTREGFFGQAYLNLNDAGKSFVYGSELFVVDKSKLYNVQLQYDRTFGRHSVVGGVDLQFTRPDTEGKINGRNEERDNTDEYGAYAQGQVEVSKRLALTGALRGDYDSVTEEFRLSPRVATTLHVGPRNRERLHTVRSSFNVAFSSPGTNSNFLDIIAATGALTVRGRGSVDGYNWQRNPAFLEIGAPTDLVGTSLIPGPLLGQPMPQGMFLDDAYAVILGGLAQMPATDIAAAIEAGLRLPAGTITEQTVQFILSQLPAVSQVPHQFSPGILGILNPTTQDVDRFVADLEDIEPLKKTVTTTVELGYTGVFENVGKGLVVNLDGYYSKKSDFVGPLLVETPLIITPTLSQGLTSSLAQEISLNPTLTGALAQLGATPAQAAALIAGFAPGAWGVVQPVENNAGPGSAPEIMLAYRNFGEIKYLGLDVSLELQASKSFSFFGNFSFVSDDFWRGKDLGEEETSDLLLTLNGPRYKGRIGGQYDSPSGFYFNAAGRYTDSFPISSGPYVGVGCRLDGEVDDCLPSYFLLDVGAGFVFKNQLDGLRFGVTVNNVLDDRHKEFIGAPTIGRMAIARLTYTIK